MSFSATRRRVGRRWILGPAAVSLGATLIFALPIRVFGLALPEPVFPLVAAFVWAALRPSVVAPIALVALGLFLDLVWGGSLGLWPICLIAAHILALSVRRLLSGEGYVVLWIWYGAGCFVAFGVGLIALRAASGVWPSLTGAALQAAITTALFPLAWWLIERYPTDEGRLK